MLSYVKAVHLWCKASGIWEIAATAGGSQERFEEN